MTLRSESRLERLLHRGMFCVTAEVVPPRSADASAVTRQARGLVGYADAANVTDNPAASVHLSAVVGSGLVAGAGVEPVLQLTCRDRNRLALSADLLGAWALGARNLLCLTGDPPSVGDGSAKGVYDLSVLDLVRLADTLRTEGRMASGDPIDDPPRFFIGVADVPLADPYDFARLEAKADAGADFVQTQIVFDVDSFGVWAEEARRRGVFERMFVLVGVAVPRGPKSARYMRDHLPGVVVPDRFIRALDESGPDGAEREAVRLTVEVVAKLKAIQGVAGIHVMGLGRIEPVRSVIETAGLAPRPALA